MKRLFQGDPLLEIAVYIFLLAIFLGFGIGFGLGLLF
jgi:hypothetical protein